MNVIQPYVSDTLKKTLNDIFQSIAPHFDKTTNLINHKLFYCNKWEDTRNKHTYLLDMLRNECDRLRVLMEENTLLQINYICAPPDCTDQLFHIDYLGDSISIFIPLVDLSDLNGTEYLYFYDDKNYLLFFDLMLEMSDNYFTKTEAIEYMISKGFIYKKAWQWHTFVRPPEFPNCSVCIIRFVGWPRRKRFWTCGKYCFV